jgi:hypothetical protein
MFTMVLLLATTPILLFRGRLRAVREGRVSAKYSEIFQGETEPETTAQRVRAQRLRYATRPASDHERADHPVALQRVVAAARCILGIRTDPIERPAQVVRELAFHTNVRVVAFHPQRFETAAQ